MGLRVELFSFCFVIQRYFSSVFFLHEIHLIIVAEFFAFFIINGRMGFKLRGAPNPTSTDDVDAGRPPGGSSPPASSPSLTQDHLRTASVRAETFTELQVMRGKDFRALAEVFPELKVRRCASSVLLVESGVSSPPV